MDKKTVLNEIMRVYDENAELKATIKGYEIATAHGRGDLAAVDNMAPITIMCIDAGRRALWEHVIEKYHFGNDWHDSDYPVHVKSGGEVIFLTYDQWIKTLNYRIFTDSNDKETQFYLDCIKQYSMNDLINFFSTELHEVYDDLVNKKKMSLVREAKNEQ